LNVIAGYTDMFRDGLIGELTPIQEKAIETVARQSKELQGLINSVLLAINIETAPLHIEWQDVNLWEFFAELRSVYDQPLAKNVKLFWDSPPDLPTVQGDRNKLKRIVENLIDNAIRFTDHGAISISVRFLAAKNLLELKVTDSDIGIPATQKATMLDRPRQAQDSDTSTHHGGAGLGLFVVKKYVDLLGGTVAVESQTDTGSTFTLHIPAPLQKRAEAHEQLSAPMADVS